MSGVAIADGYEYEPVGKSFAAPAKVFSWTGFYVGGHAGYSWADVDGVWDSDDAPVRSLSALNLDNSFGGVQAGYNYQYQQFVVGIEGDWSRLRNSDSVFFDDAGTANDDTLRAEIDYLASIRARFGWAWQNVMAYGTVGWGWTEFEFSNTELNVGSGKISLNEDGIVYGGGLELGLTKAVLVRAEYLHYDVGTRRALTNPPIPDASLGDVVRFDDIDVVRGAISFKFN